ncbi:MAG TPA: SGNH hydrolase domain-containing protein [Solirubrobacterales bacterium]|nr:SGNH hydrolase domain-containing protein [Solirubrobacterales bacterium]
MKPVALRVLFAGLLVLAALMVMGESPPTGVADQFQPSLDKARKDRGELARDNCRAHGKRVKPLVCFYGRNDSKKRVVLFGDSHALQWGPALIPLARKRGWSLVTVLRSGCPIANVAAESKCAKWRGNALRQIERLRPNHIIISTSIGNRYRLKHQGHNLSRKASEGRLKNGMVRTIRRLKKIDSLVQNRTAVTLIRDQILAPFVPAECLSKNKGRTEKCTFRNKRKFGPGFDWKAARETGIGPTIDPVKALCGQKWCSPTHGKILKYRDADHITATYARSLSVWLDQRLGIG